MPPSRKYEDYPFSVNLSAAVRRKLKNEAAKRGDMPLGGLIRMIVDEWIALNDRRVRRKKAAASEQTEAK